MVFKEFLKTSKLPDFFSFSQFFLEEEQHLNSL
ncbi:hypothetical protein Spaf_0365 [Streptococcus parasanguinis FW213]|uniref:Uncharacterized protein n=1 Tax=Streptococcus parasanguinis FW213 TaxID=1114965 RepID=I1ZK09_STRPA|nr:hypothetical protein Spaf_0365 [Streptococcus parasanguinis FW213]